MTELMQILLSLPTLCWKVFIEYRLFNRIFQKRFSMPLIIAITLCANILSGWANLFFKVAGTIPGNDIYYGVVAFLTYWLTFKGPKLKILFFTVVLYCSAGIGIYMILPFCYSWGSNDIQMILAAIEVAAVLSRVLYTVFLEYIGRRFEHLRYELPKDYVVYLMMTMIFVYMAIFAVNEVVLVWYDGNLPFSMALACCSFAVAGTALVVMAVFAVDRQVTVLLRQQQYDLQAKNFKVHEEEWRRIARFRHDFKNHLICLNGLIAQGRTQDAENYTTKLANTVEQLENKVHTGNNYADAILGEKYNEALSKGIRISVDMNFPEQVSVEPADLCCILGNITDNAIEECMKMEESQRWISIKAFRRQQQLIIEIKNSIAKEVKPKDGKFLSGKGGRNHGFGIENVCVAVEKYNGVVDISTEDCFSFSVLLPMNHS